MSEHDQTKVELSADAAMSLHHLLGRKVVCSECGMPTSGSFRGPCRSGEEPTYRLADPDPLTAEQAAAACKADPKVCVACVARGGDTYRFAGGKWQLWDGFRRCWQAAEQHPETGLRPHWVLVPDPSAKPAAYTPGERQCVPADEPETVTLETAGEMCKKAYENGFADGESCEAVGYPGPDSAGEYLRMVREDRGEVEHEAPWGDEPETTDLLSVAVAKAESGQDVTIQDADGNVTEIILRPNGTIALYRQGVGGLEYAPPFIIQPKPQPIEPRNGAELCRWLYDTGRRAEDQDGYVWWWNGIMCCFAHRMRGDTENAIHYDAQPTEDTVATPADDLPW